MKTELLPSARFNILFLLIILGTLYIYSKPLTGPFIWDDEHFVLRNPAITSIDKLDDFFLSRETYSGPGDFSIYRPLRNVSYLIDYLIFGLNPAGFHMINLLLHIQNIILLAYLARLLTGSYTASIISASLFALHPVQTEAVSWIKGRDDLIATFFYLSSFVLYIRADQKRIFYFGSIASFALALFSKEASATLPLVILLYNLHFRKEKKDKIASLHPYIYAVLVYLTMRTAVVEGMRQQAEYWGGSFMASVYTNWTGMAYYLKLIFFPVNLCADYLMFPVRTAFLDPYVMGALLVIILSLSVAAVSYLKGMKALSFSILWFFVTLLPVSNLVPIQIIIAERFLYLPSIGIFLGAAVLLDRLIRKTSAFAFRPVLISVATTALFLASMTVDRNHVWTDEHLFWSDVAAKSPGNTRAWHNLAASYQNQGKISEAVSLYQKALMMDYHSPETHYQLGRIYRGIGDDEKALNEFFEAVRDDPENADIHYEIGNLMSKKEWFNEAIIQYRKALESDPGHEDALYDLGIVYMKKGDFGPAAMQFRSLLMLVPENKLAAGFLEYCENMAKGGS